MLQVQPQLLGDVGAQDREAEAVEVQQHVHHVPVVRISVGAAVPGDDVEIVGASNHTLGEEKARDELLVLAWGSHRDAEADAAEADLEWLLDGEVILAFRGAPITHLDNAMTNDGNAPWNF